MKVKEIERTVNTAWSPGDHHPILLAAGTAAQQLDASFNTSAALEIFSLNLTDPSPDLESKYSVPSQHRYHKLAWGGGSGGEGVLVGGSDSGVLQMYSVSKLLGEPAEDGLIASPERHTGAVRALDFNPFQKNLLATGAASSEIFIWDMNNTSTPMSPGVKSQPLEDVACLAWNRQVQHILASTFPTRNVVWDLRKNEPIIKLTDATTRVRWKVVAWHPEVATQLCLASEEDSSPLVQLWDLRFATSPLKAFKGHDRGVLSLAWCHQDPDLLISSGKDNRILCWNPNSTNTEGELVCEIPNSQQWIFEVNWCPRNPSLIVSSSCDGRTSVYSITGSPASTSLQTNTKIADSFPGMGQTLPEPSGLQSHHQPVVDLKRAPKWLRRPVGAAFGFGGKLVTFDGEGVKLLQVEGDSRFLAEAQALGERLRSGDYCTLCRGKEGLTWRYLEASFSPQPRVAIRTLLGYDKEAILGPTKSSTVSQNNIDQLSDQFNNLGQDSFDGGRIDSLNYSNSEMLNGGDSVFDKISAQNSPVKVAPFSIALGNDVDSRVCKALLAGCLEEAISICLSDGKVADALILSITAGPDLLARTQRTYFQSREGYLPRLLEALVTEDWRPVAASCALDSWREALAAILTYCTDGSLSDLCYELGRRLEEAGGEEYSSAAEVCYIASGNIAPLIHKRLSNTAPSLHNIQELVELVLVAQGAYSSRGEVFPIVGEVAQVLRLYGELLSAQGDLETALEYLSDSGDECIVELRERLYYALGHKSLPGSAGSGYISSGGHQLGGGGGYQQQQHQPPQSVQPQHQHQSQRRVSSAYQKVVNSQPMGAPMNAFTTPPGAGGGLVQQQGQQGGGYTGGFGQQGGGYTGGGLPGGLQSQQQQALPPPPPPAASTSAFLRSSPSPKIQGGLSSKKYVVDPSVGGGSGGGPGGPYRSSSTLPYGPGQAPAFQTSPGFQPFQPPGSSSTAAFQQQQQPGPVSSAATFPAPAASAFQPGSAFQPPLAQSPGFGQTSFNPQQPISQTFNKPPVTGGPQPAVLSSQHAAPSGWNDPPPSFSSKPQKSEPMPSQTPITHPLFGSGGGGPPGADYSQQQHQQPPPPPGGGFRPPSVASQPFQPQQQQAFHFQPQQQQAQFQPQQQQSQFQPQQQQQHSQFQPQQQTFQPQHPTRPPSQMNQSGGGDVAEVNKPPLPEHYLRLQTTLEDLKTKCIGAAVANQQMRRKMEDVSRKLEALYDSLRDGKLSDSTIAGLEELTECVRHSDYSSGQQIITRLVSGSDFSSVATFTTGLKVLLQVAQQLRIN